MNLLMHLIEHFAVFGPLGFDCCKQVPDLAGTLLDGKRPEAHLEAVEDRPESGRAGDDDAAFALDVLRQACTADDFGKEALDGKEEDAEVRCLRRAQILLADIPGTAFHAGFELLAGGFHPLDISLLLRVEQALVVLDGELGIDRQPDDFVFVGALAGELDGKLDALAPVLRGHVGCELVGIEDLLEHGPELHFAPGASCLHVREDFLEVADTCGKGLHFAQTLVHLLKALAHLPEGIAQALIQCALELFVHGLAHLLELFGIVCLDSLELVLYRNSDRLQFLFIGFRQLADLGGHCLELRFLPLRKLAHGLRARFRYPL